MCTAVVKGVFVPIEWMEATKENFPEHEATHKNIRWGFVGVEAGDTIEEAYLGKRVPDQYRKRGSANPVRFIDP
jgi:hypothetical protein